MILPLYAALDRIEPEPDRGRRDLGAGRVVTFRRVTLPMSRPAIFASMLLIALPMLGDYFTNDLLSASPKTAMVGNLINDCVGTRPARPGRPARLVVHARLVLLRPDALLRAQTSDEGDVRCDRRREPTRRRTPAVATDRAGPAGPPRPAGARTTRGGRRACWPWSPVLYLVWSLLPVALAVMFSFNARPVAHDLAGLLDALVLRRPEPVGLATTRRCTPRCRTP